MPVSTNPNKDMVTHYCECSSTRMTKFSYKIIYRKYAWKDSQYVAQLRSISHEVHKHISVTIYVTFTKILIKTHM